MDRSQEQWLPISSWAQGCPQQVCGVLGNKQHKQQENVGSLEVKNLGLPGTQGNGRSEMKLASTASCVVPAATGETFHFMVAVNSPGEALSTWDTWA